MPDRRDFDHAESPNSGRSWQALSKIAELVTVELEDCLDKFQQQVSRMCGSVDLLERANQLGLRMVYLSRREALEEFIRYLNGYLDRPESQLYIVGSSLRGALKTTPGLQEIILKAIPTKASPKKELCVLLTHPKHSGLREQQEERNQGDITDEIFDSIRWLREKDVTEELCEELRESCPTNPTGIKLYKGTPTCFLIATDERMLLNPYPFEKEAFECFCLYVNNVENPGSIYYQYFTHHFSEPWTNRRGNTLDYKYFPLEGPNPNQRLEEGPDLFVIQDATEFYLAVFLRGKPSLPTVVEKVEIADNKDSVDQQRTPEQIHLGDEFVVKLLRLKENGQKGVWEDFEGLFLFNKERRRGKVIGTHPGDFDEFYMLGVFSQDEEKYRNPHKHKPDWAPPCLKDEFLPLFWKWLKPPRGLATPFLEESATSSSA